MKPSNGNRPRQRNDDKPLMTDEQAASFRQRLIAAGVIKEFTLSGGDRADFMTPEEAERYRQNLIDQGVLKPGNGHYRSSRPRMPRPNGSDIA